MAWYFIKHVISMCEVDLASAKLMSGITYEGYSIPHPGEPIFANPK